MRLVFKKSLVMFAVFMVSAPVMAAESLSFDLVIKDHKFAPATLTIPADTKVTLNVKNEDATPEEFESHDLKREKIIPGKSQATILVGPLKAGTYRFVGEFHEATAKGEIVVK